MASVQTIVDRLESWFPLGLAEEWDNTGLLMGDREAKVARIMTCLTITPASADEAIDRDADLIVSHHPVWFRGTKRLVADSLDGFLYRLARKGIAIYSPHTAYDGAVEGINEQLAQRVGLVDPQSLGSVSPGPMPDAIGRMGRLEQATSLEVFARRVKEAMKIPFVQFVGDSDHRCLRVAVVCGSGGELLEQAAKLGCDTFLTGELRFHAALEAEAMRLGVVLAGHFATERFALETLAERLSKAFPTIQTWASERERDPLRTLG